MLNDIELLTEKLNLEVKADSQFQISQAITNINNWKMHSVRARNQEVAKSVIFSSMSDDEVLIVLDWVMKYLPRKFREDNCDWFAKRGIPWYISVVFRRNHHICAFV